METLDTLEAPHNDDIVDCSPAGPCHGRRRAHAASPTPHRHLWRHTAAVCVVVVLVVGTLVWADTRRDAARARAAAARTTVAVQVVHADADAQAARASVVATSTGAAQHGDITTQAVTALAGAHEAAGSSPHAGDAVAPMSSAAGAVAGALTTRYSPVSLRSLVDRLSLAQDAVVEAEAQWQADENARVAAQAAVQERARQAGARAAPAPEPPQPVPSALVAAAPTMAVCAEAVGSPAVSSTALGQAVNAWRANQDLPALTAVTSGTLSGHAMAMVASGTVWHSGADNIVGCAASAAALVDAWAASEPHRALLASTEVSVIRVGAATDGRSFYGAVRFG